jgi:hypothetical protein
MSLNTPDAAHDCGKLGTFPFVLAGLSFIPMFGVLFGLITVCWGLISKRAGGRKLALIGASGVGFTILLYGGLFYFGFMQRGGVYDDLRAKMAQNNLNTLVKEIEFYRLSKGEYPDTLDDLKKSLPRESTDTIFTIDPRIINKNSVASNFYYLKVDSGHYYLRGVAPDGKPFSPGALVPVVSRSPNIGLLVDAPDQPGGAK